MVLLWWVITLMWGITGSGLAIIDITDPTSPLAPVYMDTSGYAIGVTVIGNYAYVADGTSGLAIIDITDPTSPGAPVYEDTTGSAYGVTVIGNYAYVGDESSGLAVIPLNTALIQDAAGNNATLTLAGVGATNSLGANKALVIDNIVSTVTAVTSTKANGSYKQGDLIPITATFSEAMAVTGIPQITLETGSSDAVVNYTAWNRIQYLNF